MIIKLENNKEIDTSDLSPEERHVLQKLFGWKSMAGSIEQFRSEKKKALSSGWNNSGPLRETEAIRQISSALEKELKKRISP